MKKLIFLLATILAPTLAFGQGVAYSGMTLSPSGRPTSANVAVCNSPGLITTAAQVIGNTAILTFGSSPITAGFAQNMQITVSGFTGGDTYFNVGTLNPFTSTVTIIGISSTTISYPLVHANASAGTNGSIFQMGNVSTPCAPLASIYSDQAVSVPIVQPGFVSSNIGNFQFFVNPGNFEVQFYGPGIITYLQPLTLTFVQSNGTNTFTALQTFNAGITSSGPNTLNGATTLPTGSTLTKNDAGVFTGSAPQQYLISNINSCNFVTEQGGNVATDAISGCVATPSSATIHQTNGLAGYVNNSSTSTNAVGSYSRCRSLAANAPCWGMNTVSGDSVGNPASVIGHEIDIDPRNAATSGYALGLNGNWVGTQPTTYSAIQIFKPGAQQWPQGINFQTGATSQYAINLLPAASGVSQPSQLLDFTGNNAAGVLKTATLNADLNGNLIITPSSATGFASSPAFQSSAANPAATGAFRLANADKLAWRNSANNADHSIGEIIAGRITTGSINATTRADVTLTWGGSGFADTNYTPQCGVTETTVAAGTQSLTVERIHTVNATTIIVSVFNGTGGALTGTLNCIGIHD